MMEEQQGAPPDSCMTARSDRSMGHRISFEKQFGPSSPEAVCKDLKTNLQNNSTQQGALCPKDSCISLKSSQSKFWPLNFKPVPQVEESLPDTGLNQSTRVTSDFQSSSGDVQPQSEFKHNMSHNQIMKELKMRIDAFVESELNDLDRLLNGEDLKERESEEENCREAVLQLSTHFLMKMNQSSLADFLLDRTKFLKCMSKLKTNLKKGFQYVSEGVSKQGQQTALNEIYTDLWITEGNSGSEHFEHEVCQIQTDARKHRDKTVKCEELFKNSFFEGQSVKKIMLTKGVAGIGKTLCVRKVVLDWIDHKAHNNIRIMLPFSFRELNVLKDKKFNFEDFLRNFFPEIVEAGICKLENNNVVFIFDGLDESRLDLDFNCQNLNDITEAVALNVLLVNLFRGKLIPSAQVWITSRPAAANQIPVECVSVVTEVRGFSDPQKEEYFKKRFKDAQAKMIIDHMKKNSSLHNMCYIPIFCWILSTVLEHVMDSLSVDQLPHTLTEMYIHFLVVQSKVKNCKYDGRSETECPWTLETRKMMQSLGKLAFDQLLKRNQIFYESELNEYGLNPAAISDNSGLFRQVLKEEQGLYQNKVYCFIHLSVQEFLAALHVHLTFFNSGVNLLRQSSITKPKLKPVNDRGAVKDFYCHAVEQALKSPYGHLDLFLQFLLGLSLQANQKLLHGLTKHIQPSSQSSREVASYVKEKIREMAWKKDKVIEGLDSDKTINLFHCLNELGDKSLMEEVQKYLTSGNIRDERLSSVQWSALVFLLKSSNIEVFELRKFGCSAEAFLHLLPVIKLSTEASLSGCTLSTFCCKKLSRVLMNESCLIKKLDLSYTELQDSGLFTLENALNNLQVLSLRGCRLTDEGYRQLRDLLSSSLCALTQLNVSDNCLQKQGVKLLCEGLRSSHCKLTSLRMNNCNLTSACCEDLSKILQCQTSALKDLNLSNNQLEDSGIELLCSGLLSPHCKLNTLRLSGCMLTAKSFYLLEKALDSCQLTELDLQYNHPDVTGLDILSAAVERPGCRLTTLKAEHGEACRLVPGLKKYACEITLDLKTAHRNLVWFENNTITEESVDSASDQDEGDHFDSWYQVLCNEGFTGRCYWEVKCRGFVSIAVAYKGMKRKGISSQSMLGGNHMSWALDCSPSSYFAWHNDREKYIPRRGMGGSWSGTESTVAVYLDWEEGVLSFFTVLPDNRLELIHTFQSAFSEPLYPAFRLRSEYTLGGPFCSVKVCPVLTFCGD